MADTSFRSPEERFGSGLAARVGHVSLLVMDGVALTMFVVLFLLLVGNVVVRWLGMFSMAWFDEIVEMAFAWMVFFGAASLWQRRDHFRIDWLEEQLRALPAARRSVQILVSGVSLMFLACLLVYGWRLFDRTTEITPIFAIPRRYLYLCIPLSATVMVVVEVVRLVGHLLSIRGDRRRGA